MAKFCKNCGQEINLESGFCPKCGTPISEITNNTEINYEKKDNTVTAFVLSLLGFICCTYLAIPGLIMSIIALQDMNKNVISNKNKGLAIAGIILGALGIIVLIINLINPNVVTTEMIEEWLD